MRGRWSDGPVWLATTLILLCGCNPTTSPSTVSARPPQNGGGLSCSLPVVTRLHAGFVDLPSLRFREDRSYPRDSAMGAFYAQGAHRWIRAQSTFGYLALSPDGTELVQFAPGSPGNIDVYLENLTNNKSRRVGSVANLLFLHPIGFVGDDLYLAGGYVYRLNVRTGNVDLLGPNAADASRANQGLWFWATSAGAWYSLIAGPNQGDRNSVYSLSPDGKMTTWYTAPTTRSVSIIGFVRPDEPLAVEYNTEPYEQMTGVVFRLLTAPGTSNRLTIDPSINAWGFTDSMGVWLSSPGHLWLYNANGLSPVGDLTHTAIGSDLPGVAGPCR